MSTGGFPFAEGPEQSSLEAVCFWRPDWNPSALIADARPVSSTHPDAFDIAAFGDMATVIVTNDGREFLSLSDGQHRLHIELRSGTLLDGPIIVRFDIDSGQPLREKAAALLRFQCVRDRRRLPPGPAPTKRATQRVVNALRAFDAVQAGAKQREIAQALWGENILKTNWGTDSDCFRSNVQRLIRTGRELVDGGYRRLLGVPERVIGEPAGLRRARGPPRGSRRA